MEPGELPAPERELATATARVAVTFVAGAHVGQTFELACGRYTLGSSASCDIVITDDPFVSRQHLELAVSSDGVRARDLESRNGSFFERGRFAELEVPPGCELTIGATRFRVDGCGEAPERFGALVGRSLEMREVFDKLHRLARSDASLLVDGETGTGKELCARAVHEASLRRHGPFVVCDLAALPRMLIESELFGHLRGAFTGADRDRVGAFAQAAGGTILLDEVGELPLDAQPVLLRALENRTIKPLGAARPLPVDVRVIATTHRDLAQAVKAGRFRADLFYRLSVCRVTLPPLRERTGDIPLLVDTMLDGKRLTIPARSYAALRHHTWPGNVRELRNAIDRALSSGAELAEPACFGLPDAPGAGDRADSFRDARSLWEREYVARLIERTQGNVSLAAREAGLGRTHLYQLMRKHGLCTASDLESTYGGRTARFARGSQNRLR